MKIFEALLIAFASIVVALIASYLYLQVDENLFVMMFDTYNLGFEVSAVKVLFEGKILIQTALLYLSPYVLFIIFPIYKLAISEPASVLR